MANHRLTAAVLTLAVSATFAGTAAQAQAPRGDPTSPASSSRPTTAPSAGKGLTGAQQPDSAASRSSPTTAPSAGRGLGTQPGTTSTDTTTPGAGAITGGVPAMSGVVPNRAELASSAFTKLDAGSRGYVTLEDVRQLDGFETHFRQADQNKDGRLNPSEFNAAWAIYSGTTR